MNFPWPDSPHVPGSYCVAGRCARAFDKVDTGCGRNQTPPCLCHYNGDIEQVIEMSVRHQNRVWVWRELAQSIIDAREVRLNPRTKCHAQKVHAREVRIHKQGMASEFELVTVRAEISHAHSVARCARRICHNQIGI